MHLVLTVQNDTEAAVPLAVQQDAQICYRVRPASFLVLKPASCEACCAACCAACCGESGTFCIFVVELQRLASARGGHLIGLRRTDQAGVCRPCNHFLFAGWAVNKYAVRGPCFPSVESRLRQPLLAFPLARRSIFEGSVLGCKVVMYSLSVQLDEICPSVHS